MKTQTEYKGSIKRRLIFIIMSVSFLTVFIGYGSFVYWYMQNQSERTVNLAKTVGLVLGQDFAKLLFLNDISSASDISASLKSFPRLESMVLYNLDKKPVLKYSKNNENFSVESFSKNSIKNIIIKDNILTLYINANYQDTHLGYTQYKFNIDTLWDVAKQNIISLLAILILMLIISYILTTYFAKRFTKPITNLVSFLEKIELSNSSNKKIVTNELNEYGKLYEEVNLMLQRINISHKAIELAAAAFETQNGIIITDKNQNILLVNKAFSEITGYKEDEVIGKTPKILQSGLHDKEFYDNIRSGLEKNKFWSGMIINKHKSGKIVKENLTIHTVLDDEKNVMYYIASFVDTTLYK